MQTDIIDARLSGKQSLLHTEQHQTSSDQTTQPSKSDAANGNCSTYSTMLRLISGSMIGESVYTKLYDDLDKVDNTTNKFSTPTLSGIARKVAKVEKLKLDHKQYIAYEMICCSFLLGLINDGEKKGTRLSECLDLCLEDCSRKKKDLTEELHARSGEEQLRMFLTGPAGAGKSTAVKVAQRFCFEFS